MPFFKPSNENKRFAKSVERICKVLNIDKSVALHFINADLERISNNNLLIDNIQLSHLENEIRKHLKSESELHLEIEEKGAFLKSTLGKIDDLSSSLKEKTELLVIQQEKLSQLQVKVNELNAQLKDTDKKKKLADYSIMMKSHTVKKASNRQFKYLKIFLVLITILAVILATILIYKK